MSDETIAETSDAIGTFGLRIGNETAATALSADAFDHVVSVAAGLTVPATTHSVDLHVDERATSQAEALADAADLVATGLERGESVFVHCYEGKERAPTVGAVALARPHGWTFERGLAEIETHRPLTEPTPNLRQVGRRVVGDIEIDE